MDAYDLIEMMKTMWVDKVDKSSGQLDKSKGKIGVVVHTDEGYRNVIGVFWNRETNKIELVLDTE